MVRSIARRQQVSALALFAVLASAPAFAQDATLGEARTTTLRTSGFNIGNNGTLTVTADGSVTVGNGTAIIVDGNHNIALQSSSTITSNDIAAGRGLLVDTSNQRIQADLTLAGSVSVAVQAAGDFNESNNTTVVGLLIDGDQGYAGDITIEDTAVFDVHGSGGRGFAIDTAFEGNINYDGDINVIGVNTIGIDINGPVTGNVTIDGSVNTDDEGAVAVRVGDRIDGSFVIAGNTTAGDIQTADNQAEPAKAVILIEDSITGGVLFEGVGQNNDVDDDGNPDVATDSTITSTGGAPALLVDSTESGNDIVIGEVGDTGFSWVHKGRIETLGGSNGLEATGVEFRGTADAPVTLEGGIWFDTGSIALIAQDNNSTGLIIGDNVTVPNFLSEGIINIGTNALITNNSDGTQTRGVGGVATGILIEEGGSLSSFTNGSAFQINSLGENQNAYGIRDLSGSLTSFTNTGNFLIATDSNGGGDAIALDVRANTSGFNLTNSGTFVGDVLMGDGDDTVTLDGGTLEGDLSFGLGNNTLNIRNEAVFSGSSSFEGTLDLSVNDADIEIASISQLNFTNADFSGDAELRFIVNPEAGQNGQLVITDTLTASSGVDIVPVITRITNSQQSFDLITASNITLADAGSSLALSNTPYLFDVSLAQNDSADGSTITLNVRPKDASELNINSAATGLYDNIVTSGLDLDNVLEASLSSLTTQETTEAALNALLPDITGGSTYLAQASRRQLANHLSNRLGDYVEGKSFASGGWAREVTSIGDRTSQISAFDANLLTVGLTFGYDAPVNKNLVVGVNAGFTLNGLSGKDDTIDSELSTFAPFTSIYALTRAGGFYLGGQATAQYVAIRRERNIEFGTVDRLVTSRTNGWNFVATAEAGYNLSVGKLNIKPFGRIAAQNYSEGGYTEEGGDSANLTVESTSFTRVDGTVGAALGYDFNWKTRNETRIVRPEIFYSYTQNLSGADAEPLEAIFVGGDTSFLAEVDRTAKSVEQIGGAFNIFGIDSTARIHYAYEKLDQQRAHSVSFNFGLAF
ncbi:autotransporter domain-containing protein [Kordiimonas laminariae]|uniref:autotransporter domain-containing protein n=1 Tax=Kordiimonas laminariae TaxID=2917717 RepID=UPI001FF103BC|nr:autotransporter outer membrane beta-barrel domain-containing protein [Kordiimonas laminariae]